MKLGRKFYANFIIAVLLSNIFLGALPVSAAAISNLAAKSVNDGEHIVLTWDEKDFSNSEAVYIWRRPFAPETPPAHTVNFGSNATTVVAEQKANDDHNPKWTQLPTIVSGKTAGKGTYTDTNLTPGNSYMYHLSLINSPPPEITITGTGPAAVATTLPPDLLVSNWAASKPVVDTTLNATGQAIQNAEGRLNIARGKPVIGYRGNNQTNDATQSVRTRQLWKMVDGMDSLLLMSPTTAPGQFWGGVGVTTGSLSSTNNVKVRIDLLKTEKIDTVVLVPRVYESNNTGGWGPRIYQIYVSGKGGDADLFHENNICTPTAITNWNNETSAPTFRDISRYTHDLGEGREGRYVGINITQQNSPTTLDSAQIRELKVLRAPKPTQLTYELDDEIWVNPVSKHISAKILYPDSVPSNATAIFALYSDKGDELLGAEVIYNFAASNGNVTLTKFADYIKSGKPGIIKCLIWNYGDKLTPLVNGKINVLNLTPMAP